MRVFKHLAHGTVFRRFAIRHLSETAKTRSRLLVKHQHHMGDLKSSW